MPIYDKNGVPLVHHVNFPEDEVQNIEFGAGRNNFGKREFPNCYLTDLIYPKLQHFTTDENYEQGNYHFIDGLCNFYEYNFNKRFDRIILCNPFNYGYKELGGGKLFFDRIDDLLTEDGEVHIIGKACNPWCSKESLDEYFENQLEPFKPKSNFEIKEYEILPLEHNINLNYIFYKTELNDRTIPDERLVIKRI